ncbi:MAG: hypothetical protein ABSF83_09735 [Nitrososphaerales archaeon]|jgi:uncharacterized membrane protein
MRKRTVVIGLILLVVGIAFVAGGIVGLKGATSTISTFTTPQTGEYVSSEIVLNSSGALVVVRPSSSTGGLIPAQALSEVSSTSLATYALTANSTSGGSATYISIKEGDYYYVIFTSSQPTTKITLSGSLFRTAESGILVLLGGVLVLAGLIVTIVGAIRKSNKPKQPAGVTDADYYSKRQGGGSPPPPPPPNATISQNASIVRPVGFGASG